MLFPHGMKRGTSSAATASNWFLLASCNTHCKQSECVSLFNLPGQLYQAWRVLHPFASFYRTALMFEIYSWVLCQMPRTPVNARHHRLHFKLPDFQVIHSLHRRKPVLVKDEIVHCDPIVLLRQFMKQSERLWCFVRAHCNNASCLISRLYGQNV